MSNLELLKFGTAKVGDIALTVLLVLTLVFVALRVLPGDPALTALGIHATPDQLAEFRKATGLDQSLGRQYWDFLTRIASFDLGASLVSGEPVARVITANLLYTVELTIGATLIGAVVGVPSGIAAAMHANRGPDSCLRVFSLLGYAIPDFYLGALCLIFFSLNLGWFPISGGGVALVDRLYHLVLPASTLAILKIAFLGRLTRTNLLETLSRGYIRTARAKGASERTIMYRHALPNAMMPIVTGLGLSVLSTLSGAVTVELVFNRPGIGAVLVNAISERDYTLVQGTVIVFSLTVVIVNAAVDLLYSFIDPRMRRA